MLNEQLVNKWQPVLDHEDLPEIKECYRKIVTAHMLEQQETALAEEAGTECWFCQSPWRVNFTHHTGW